MRGQVVTLREQTRHLGQCAVKKQGWLKQLAEKEVYLSELRNLAQSLAAGKKQKIELQAERTMAKRMKVLPDTDLQEPAAKKTRS